MPEEFDETEQEPEDHLVQLKRSDIRALQAKAKKADEAESRALAAERTLVFRDAGIPDSAATGYFVKGYDGELTAEAIKAAAVEAGFLSPPEPAVSSAEQQGMENMAAASATGEAIQHSTDADYQASLANAKTEAEVMALAAQHGTRIKGMPGT